VYGFIRLPRVAKLSGLCPRLRMVCYRARGIRVLSRNLRMEHKRRSVPEALHGSDWTLLATVDPLVIGLLLIIWVVWKG
jgi:hypothetical protein